LIADHQVAIAGRPVSLNLVSAIFGIILPAVDLQFTALFRRR
jgi:hypothetical protein